MVRDACAQACMQWSKAGRILHAPIAMLTCRCWKDTPGELLCSQILLCSKIEYAVHAGGMPGGTPGGGMPGGGAGFNAGGGAGGAPTVEEVD